MKPSDHQYRRMNIDEESRPGSRVIAEYDDDMEEAQRRLEELRAQKEELDQFKRKAEEIERKKMEFAGDQNAVGERLYVAVEKIDAEIESLRVEMGELEQIRACFRKDLGLLGSIQPDSWPQEVLEQQLGRALEVLEGCNDDYNDAVDHCMQMKHTRVLTRSRRKRNSAFIGLKEVGRQFQQGLAFHLPLVVLLILVFIVYSCVNQPSGF